MKSSGLPILFGKTLVMTFATWAISVALAAQMTAAETRKSFDAPEEAAQSLVAALKSNDEQVLLAILGKSLKEWIESGDPAVADRSARDNFISAYDQKHAIERDNDGKANLVIGDDEFPFPIW